MPSLDDPTLSPAGDRLACLVREDDRRYIIVTELATGKPVAATRIDDAKVRSLRWYDPIH